MDANIHLVLAHHLEQFIGIMLEFLSRMEIVEQRRSCQLDVLGRQSAGGRHQHPYIFFLIDGDKKTYAMVTGGTAPLAFPKLIILPFLATASILPSNVLFPTPSKMTFTPSPFVISLTFSGTPSFE